MATFNVSSTASLTSAMKAAVGGDVIKLAPGTYDGLMFKTAPTYASNVTLTSADPTKLATLTDFTLVGAKNITFSTLEFATLNHPDKIANDGSFWAFKIAKSSDIHFDGIKMHGSLDGNAANDVQGLQIRDSVNVSVKNSEFQQLERALAVGQTDNVKITGNIAHDLRSDGFNFAEVGHAAITGNTFHTFKPTGNDHPDAIQFWTSGTTTPSHDILISGNAILRGDGAYTQGIFLRDQIGTLPYERVTISDNLIVGTGYNGIRVQGATDLTLSKNELVSFAGDNKTFMLIQGADKVVAVDNKAAQISFDTSTNVVQSGNTVTGTVSDFGDAAIRKWMLTHADATGIAAELTAAVNAAKAAAAGALVLKAAIDPLAADNLVGTSKNDLLEGFGGNDTLNGRGGSDTLAGGAGDDVYIVPNSMARIVEKAGEGIDTVIARGEHFLAANVENLIIDTSDDRGWRGWGNELNNRMTGNAGANQLDGAAGNDTIDGGAGADTLIGGTGSDRLTGGAGDDRFNFAPGSGKDIITDFGSGPGKEMLDISAFIRAGLAPTVSQIGDSAVISFTNGDSITLMGIQASELGASSKVGWMF